MKPLELYLHIPFCIKKCKYCDFLSAPASAEEREEYVNSLCRKICACAEVAKAYRVISIFVGGGTPSVLEAEQMSRILDTVKKNFRVEDSAEITIEMNPGTVTRQKLATYRRAGVNRLSIGLQSAENKDLAMLGRIHTFEEFLVTYQNAREEGFSNINIDLISGIPHQTPESWEKTLHKIAGLSPEHISAYSLIIEEGTPFYERYGEGRHAEELPDEEEERWMYQNTKSILEAYGYHRYEISNYAKPGYECRHNIGYWDRVEYLGIGDGAASLMENRRWKEGEEPEILSVKDQMEEFMFLGLRKMEGVSKKKFREVFGISMDAVYGKVLKDMAEKGLMEEGEGWIRLTERGIDISNYVLSEFLL